MMMESYLICVEGRFARVRGLSNMGGYSKWHCLGGFPSHKKKSGMSLLLIDAACVGGVESQ